MKQNCDYFLQQHTIIVFITSSEIRGRLIILTWLQHLQKQQSIDNISISKKKELKSVRIVTKHTPYIYKIAMNSEMLLSIPHCLS